MGIYRIASIADSLKNNPYPGRGIIMGTSPSGDYGVIAYFIMGRSVNSRNRIFVSAEDGIMIEPRDPELVEDPSLIIYHPVRVCGDVTVVTNGDQTDTIVKFLSDRAPGSISGEVYNSFAKALRTRTFEPDCPNYTPRISGIMCPDGSYCLSIIKSSDPQGSVPVREFFEFPHSAGTGYLIHTYETDGNPLPPFAGEPRKVNIPEEPDDFAGIIWDSLDDDNKISLYVRYFGYSDNEVSEIIINRE